MPRQLRGMQTRVRAGIDHKHPRRDVQLQAKPQAVRDKENSQRTHAAKMHQNQDRDYVCFMLSFVFPRTLKVLGVVLFVGRLNA